MHSRQALGMSRRLAGRQAASACARAEAGTDWQRRASSPYGSAPCPAAPQKYDHNARKLWVGGKAWRRPCVGPLASHSRSCSSTVRLLPDRDAASAALLCGVARINRQYCRCCLRICHTVAGRKGREARVPAEPPPAAPAADLLLLMAPLIQLAVIDSIAQGSHSDGVKQGGAGAGRYLGTSLFAGSQRPSGCM